jgi:hypothetical protein
MSSLGPPRGSTVANRDPEYATSSARQLSSDLMRTTERSIVCMNEHQKEKHFDVVVLDSGRIRTSGIMRMKVVCV